MKLIILLSINLLGLTTAGGVFLRYNNVEIRIHNELASRDQAHISCQQENADLVNLKDVFLQSIISTSILYLNDTSSVSRDAIGYWTGGSRDRRSSVWRWSDSDVIPTAGEAGFQAWQINQPPRRSNRRSRSCLLLVATSRSDGCQSSMWISFNCAHRSYFICQRVINPVTPSPSQQTGETKPTGTPQAPQTPYQLTPVIAVTVIASLLAVVVVCLSIALTFVCRRMFSMKKRNSENRPRSVKNIEGSKTIESTKPTPLPAHYENINEEFAQDTYLELFDPNPERPRNVYVNQ